MKEEKKNEGTERGYEGKKRKESSMERKGRRLVSACAYDGEEENIKIMKVGT